MDRDCPHQRPSKYVVPTGSGYLGTYTVSTDRTVTISTAALGDLDWPTDTAHAIGHDDGVALVPRLESTESLAEYTLCRRFTGARIAVGQAVIDALELSRGEDVRVYDLEVSDGADGLLLVDAAADPRLATDGGRDLKRCGSALALEPADAECATEAIVDREGGTHSPPGTDGAG